MDWRFEDADREIVEREFASFLPPRIFDAHVHLYEKAQIRGESREVIERGPDSAGIAEYLKRMAPLTLDRPTSGLFFGVPAPGIDFSAANAFVLAEARRDPLSRAFLLVRPEMDPELIRETVRREKFAGLKCYRTFSKETPTTHATIESFLPEAQVRVAHEEKLAVTLHIVRPRALADPSNVETIRRYARCFPDMRLILAHAARGFNPYHTVEAIGKLRGLDNIWFDTSVVTECGAIEAIVRTMGVQRLMYGSDFPFSHQAGRCVALGDEFHWIAADSFAKRGPRLTLVGIEALRVLKLACLNLALSDSQIEAVFYGNAGRLIGL